MSKSPFENWLRLLEHRKNHLIFLVEWLAIFAIAWMFWTVIFTAAPGSAPAGLIATLVALLYSTLIVYGRMMKTTGCRKCGSPWPLMRKEMGRKHLRDEEHCIEVEYGGEEYGQHLVQVYCKVIRADMVTYSCRHCGQMWEERVELPSIGYKIVRRIDE